MTLGALGVRECTGQLTIRADGKQYAIVFDHGAVIGASSPLASDSAVRVALIHHLISPAQATEVTRRLAADPTRAELELLAEVAKLTLDQTVRLRRKVIEQRAARTFSVDSAEFVIESDVAIPIVSGLAIDVRSVIYLGARMNLSAQRLVDELRPFGPYFALDPSMAEHLSYFGFTDTEQQIIEALRAGTSIAALEAKYRELDPRTVQAVVYSLVACSICKPIPPPPGFTDVPPAAVTDDAAAAVTRGAARLTPSEPYSRTHSGRDVFQARTPGTGQRTVTAPSEGRTATRPVSEPRTISGQPVAATRPATQPGSQAASRTSTMSQASRAPSAAPDETGVPRSLASRTPTPLVPSHTHTPLSSELAAAATAVGAANGASGASGGAASGGAASGESDSSGNPTPNGGPAVSRTATPVADMPVQSRTRTPITPARTQTPNGLARTKSPRTRITTTTPVVPPPADAASAPAAEPPADPIAAGKEAFKRGLARLKVEDLEGAILELVRAVDLVPNEADYTAALAWARFCHASDKQSLAQATRETLNKAIRKSQNPEFSRFYLGRVERMLGRDKEALRHFQEVLDAQPKNADAAAEVRVLEARMAEAGGRDNGLFGRKR